MIFIPTFFPVPLGFKLFYPQVLFHYYSIGRPCPMEWTLTSV